MATASGALCSKLISWKPGGTTTQLWRHLRQCHVGTFTLLKDSNRPAPVTTADPFFAKPRAPVRERQDLYERIALWICRHGRPMAVVADEELRQIIRVVSLGRHHLPSREIVAWGRLAGRVSL